MKKILQFFTNKIVISMIGLIALSVVIWFVGPMIKFGENNSAPLASEISRLIAIIIVILLWGLNNLRIQLTNKKNNMDLVGDLEQNQEAINLDDSANDQSSEEYHQLNQRFSDALSTLSKLRFKGRNKSKALYQLPWYIIIGPPGSGKTTALINSSLDFPLAEQFGKGALQGVGGTRNCDWWFTNDAVLIDTAGRYTTQDSHKVVDSKAWEAFLSLLKRNRRRRPINGAIVSISIQDLLVMTEQERVQQAKIIRTRIDELMQKLEIRFPIYLMFTKADLISGFSEYFEDLSKEDREQVWGISLANAPHSSQSPDFENFEYEMDLLIKRLYDRELARVHQERDIKRRGLIQGFPLQVENIRNIIGEFVNQTFVKNRFEKQPYLRGIYFTSGTQDGTPIDRMMSAVSANFGFQREQAHYQHGQGKSFFLGNLFRDVIFPESELVGSNRKFELFLKWSRRSAYITLVISAIALLVSWFSSISQHDDYMLEVASYVTEFEREQGTVKDWNKDLRAVIPSLNALAKASIVYDQEQHPWLSGMGMYDSQVDKSADRAYHAQLKRLLLPRLISYLENKISMGHQGGDLYHNFRIYLMFQKVDHIDIPLVVDWFKNNWKESMTGEATQRQALEQHLHELLKLNSEPYKLNPQLVKQTRQVLLRVPVHQRIYSRIRTQSEYRQKVDLLNLFGESVRESFKVSDEVTSRLQIPFMFTREGYDSIDLSTESPIIADLVRDRWVLSDDESGKVDFIKDDLDEISEKVKQLYLSEFTQQWSKVLESLDIVEFKSLDMAMEVLSRFIDPVYSPLLAVLQVTAENTQLSNQLLQNLSDDNAEGKTGKVTGLLAESFKGTEVDQHFRPVNQLLRESKKRPAPIKSINQKIEQLKDFIGEIAVSPDPAKKSFQLASARFTSGSGNAITALTQFAANKPEPVKRWLEKLSDQSWRVVLSAAHQHVNNQWKNKVYTFYKDALAGRYPLSRKSKNELAQLDFTDFFKPEGKMDNFFLTYVKPFVKTGTKWSNRVVDNRSLGLSRKTLAQIHRAQNIKSILFRANPEAPGLSLQLKPYRLDKIDARFWLDVGKQRISYNHGPKFWKDLNWSAKDENNRVRFVFEDLNGDHNEKSFEGPWAWFHMQDESKLTPTKKANVYLIKYSVFEQPENGSKKIEHNMEYLIKAKSINNPFNNNLLGSFNCPESI